MLSQFFSSNSEVLRPSNLSQLTIATWRNSDTKHSSTVPSIGVELFAFRLQVRLAYHAPSHSGLVKRVELACFPATIEVFQLVHSRKCILKMRVVESVAIQVLIK